MPITEGSYRKQGAAWARSAVKTLRWDRRHDPDPASSGPAIPYRATALILCGLAIGSLVATLSNRPAPEPEVATLADAPVPAPPRAETAALPSQVLRDEASPAIYEELVDHERRAPPPPAAEMEAAIDRAAIDRAAIDRAAIDRTVAVPLPERRPARPVRPAWVENAVPVSGVAGRPMIAMVIDDLGLNRINANRTIELPAPLTLAFMTYAERLETMTARARAAGHELLVHFPMEPSDPAYDTGPNALLMANDPEELRRRLDWGLSRFEGYVGINNHMGSRFTGSLVRMARVLAELRERGLIFLDSRTSGASVGAELARRMGLAHASRDVFIDNDPKDKGAIRRQLTKLETIALERGFAVGIGHPHDATIEVLAEWLGDLERRGFALVPVSAIVRHRVEIAASDLPPR